MIRPDGLKLPTGLLATGQSRSPAGYIVAVIHEEVSSLVEHALSGCQQDRCSECDRFQELRKLAMAKFHSAPYPMGKRESE